MSFDGERNIHCLFDQLLVNGRQRGDVQREKEREERRVAEMAQNLARYKRGRERERELSDSCKRDEG